MNACKTGKFLRVSKLAMLKAGLMLKGQATKPTACLRRLHGSANAPAEGRPLLAASLTDWELSVSRPFLRLISSPTLLIALSHMCG